MADRPRTHEPAVAPSANARYGSAMFLAIKSSIRSKHLRNPFLPNRHERLRRTPDLGHPSREDCAAARYIPGTPEMIFANRCTSSYRANAVSTAAHEV